MRKARSWIEVLLVIPVNTNCLVRLRLNKSGVEIHTLQEKPVSILHFIGGNPGTGNQYW